MGVGGGFTPPPLNFKQNFRSLSLSLNPPHPPTPPPQGGGVVMIPPKVGSSGNSLNPKKLMLKKMNNPPSTVLSKWLRESKSISMINVCCVYMKKFKMIIYIYITFIKTLTINLYLMISSEMVAMRWEQPKVRENLQELLKNNTIRRFSLKTVFTVKKIEKGGVYPPPPLNVFKGVPPPPPHFRKIQDPQFRSPDGFPSWGLDGDRGVYPLPPEF